MFRSEVNLSVSDAPEDLAEARRRAAAARRERRRAKTSAPPVSFSMGGDHRETIDAAVAKDAWMSIQRWQRGVPGAGDVLREQISTGSRHLRIAIFNYLWLFVPSRGFRGRDLADAVIANLGHDDPAVARFATIACQSKHFPGAAERALALLAQPTPSADRAELAGVARSHHRPLEVQALIARLVEQETDPMVRDRFAWVLASFVWEHEQSIATPALEHLRRVASGAGDRGGYWVKETLRWPHAGPVVEATRLRDRTSAIEGLFQALDSTDRHTVTRAILAIGSIAKGSHDDDLVARLLEHRVSPAHADYSIRLALMHIRGNAADHALLAMLPDLSPQIRTEVIWTLEGWTLEHLLRRCRNAGLISQLPRGDGIDAIHHRYCGRFADNAFSLLGAFIDLMASEGAAVQYVVDTGMVPAGHDRIIRRFMRCTHPWLRPGALTEVLDQAGDERIGYTVQFIANRRRYRLELPYSRRSVWPAPILMTINDVLRDAGREERFVHLFNEEQQQFLYGIPETVRGIARQLYLPFAHDPEIAKEAVAEYLRSRTEES